MFFCNYTLSFFSNFSGIFSQCVVRLYLCIAECVYYLKLLMAVRICLAEKCYAPRSTVTGSIGQVIQLPTNEGCNRPWDTYSNDPVGVEVNATNITTNPKLSEFYRIKEHRYRDNYMRLYVRGNLLRNHFKLMLYGQNLCTYIFFCNNR